MRRRLSRVGMAVVVAAMAVLSGDALPVGGPPAQAATPTIGQLVGQKLMVAMSGTTPSSSLLGRAERGEIGGVILFAENITSASQLAALTARLQAAATAGGQPPLLISTDQEGSNIRRVPWAPPTLTAPQMGALGSSSTAHDQGMASATVLGCAGVNTNLAPVADVPASTSSFMYQQGRTWSFSPSTTAALSDAFADGIVDGGGVPAMKHFPGIGLATKNTDSNVATITASAGTLAPGLEPYQLAIQGAVPMIMLSNATYTAYDGANGAGWSKAIAVDLLRTTLGFTGVSITDALNGTAAARGVSATSLAIKAAQAGTDMLLLTGTESASAATFSALVAAATGGSIPPPTLQASYDRIVALKAGIPSPTIDGVAPDVAPPVSRFFSISTLGTSTAPVRTTWSAQDPCGISRYRLERQLDGGAWTAQTLGSGISVTITQPLSVGSTVRYRVRATDGAGNVSTWRYGPTFEPRRAQEASPNIAYTGTWRTGPSTSPSGAAVAYSTVANASATYTFTGSAVAWVAPRGPARGSAAVYVDGVFQGNVSLYAPAFAARQIVFAIHWSSPGSHTIRIVNLGTSGHPRIDLDAFVRLRGV